MFPKQTGQCLYGVLTRDWIKWAEGGETWVVDLTIIIVIIIIIINIEQINSNSDEKIMTLCICFCLNN